MAVKNESHDLFNSLSMLKPYYFKRQKKQNVSFSVKSTVEKHGFPRSLTYMPPASNPPRNREGAVRCNRSSTSKWPPGLRPDSGTDTDQAVRYDRFG